jgi:enoyl-CoA hydratase/carnithine racemase
MALRRLKVPTIAAVNGHAIGAAFSFACAADMRIIGEKAKVAVNFTQLGLHPGMGATFLLPKIVRPEVANYLLMTGKQITGKEAHELGLCLKCVPNDQVLEEALKIAREIASAGRLAVRQVKESISMPFEEGLERQLRREADAQAVSYPAPEFRQRLGDLQARTTKKSRL